MTKVKVGILSTDTAYCAFLKAVLDNAARFRPADVQSTLAEATAAWGNNAPLAILADISGVPGSERSPIELLSQIKTTCPDAPLLVLADTSEEATIFASWRAGASGYLLKDTPLARICEAVEEMLAGGCPMSPLVARRMAEWFPAQEPALEDSAEPLSVREQEILDHLADGAQNRDIAKALQLSEATVRAHLRRLYQKLQVHSRAQAVSRHKQRPKGQT